MSRIKGAALCIFIAGVICLAWLFLRSRPNETQRQPGQSAQVPAPQATERAGSESLSDAIGRATARPDVANIQALVALLRATPADKASAAIRGFLDSKADARTGLGFKIGPGGKLSEGPSIRVLLLDEWAGIDSHRAAAYSEKVLASKASADEWAIALRNYARVSTGAAGRTFLEQKLREMLLHDAWVNDPSAGFLEAFDVAVHIRAMDLIPTLAQLLRQGDNQALAHAAYLTLDRMVISDAAATLSMLQQDRELMQGRQETRANYFARADVREPTQRQVLEQYLLDPGLQPAELAKFAGLYPNANYMISHNLLTQTVTPDGTWLIARDLESLRVIGEWMADERFARLKPQLETIRTRLETFVRQAGEGGGASVKTDR